MSDLTTCVINIRYQGLLWCEENQSTMWLSWQSSELKLLRGVARPKSEEQKDGAKRARQGQTLWMPQEQQIVYVLCVCLKEKQDLIIIDIIPTLKGASLHSRPNYTGLIGFFSPASMTKTLLLFDAPCLWVHPSHHPLLFYFFLLCVLHRYLFFLKLIVWCIDFLFLSSLLPWGMCSRMTVISWITQAVIIWTRCLVTHITVYVWAELWFSSLSFSLCVCVC